MTELLIIRDTFTKKTTIGKLYINGTYFCHTLEDVIRGNGIKIYGETGIPAGEYRVKLSVSYRLKRLMPMIYTEDNEYEIKKNGIGFRGVRMHGGNRADDTLGCVIIAHNRIDDDTIQGTAEKDLVNALPKTGEMRLIVKNK